MRAAAWRIVVVLGLWFGAVSVWVTLPEASPQWQAKVDPWVLNTARDSGETEFLVFLSEQADLSAAQGLKSKEEKGRFVFETLTEVAQRTQGPLLESLEGLRVEFRPFWVANMVWVRGDLSVVQALAVRSDVAHIYANPRVALKAGETGIEGGGERQPTTGRGVEWNIALVRAPQVWAAGITGEGVVIAGQDTGFGWRHPALINAYRGWDGSSADHNYNWHDAIHSSNGLCGADSPEPCDDFNHGSHTMGIMVGDDGGENQIGMAPGAKWIGCRNMDAGFGTPATYSECFQWFIAPTDLNDENPDPTRAPHVINNSWSCPASEGCTDPSALQTVVENTRAAGIVVVASAGNGGSGCSTVASPPPIYAASFSVGATDENDLIADFSSRGPVTVDGSNRLKPEVVAPGVNIRSSNRSEIYYFESGTSMASPHVAGLVALLISAYPHLAGDVDTIESIIQQSSLPLTTTQTCGGVSGSQVPNNTYGYGRIDAWEALNVQALGLGKAASATTVYPGSLLTYTLSVTHTLGFSPTHNVVLTDVIPSGTTFVTATTPYSREGNLLQWNLPELGPREIWQVELVVRVGMTATTVENREYGVRSDEVAPLTGIPLTTNTFRVYFPLILISWASPAYGGGWGRPLPAKTPAYAARVPAAAKPQVGLKQSQAGP